MNLNTISPYVRRAMRSQLRAPFKLGQCVIFDYEIIYLASGKFLLTVEGKEYICRKGDVMLLRPGQPHTLQSIDGISISQPHIHFDMTYDEHSDKVYISFKDLPKFTDEERARIREDIFAGMDVGPILHIADKDAFTALLYEIISLFSQKPHLYQLLCKEKMLCMVQMILRDNTVLYDAEPCSTALPAMIKHYIDYNYQNPITLDTLEAQFNYSKFHISRTFAGYTGCTVIKYYSQKRLEHAKKMLRGGATVTDVVQELHFSSIYAFSRFFKTAVGCAPSEYKHLY